MTITANEMRELVNTYNETKREEEKKHAHNYLLTIVEPRIREAAKRGLRRITIDIPLTIEDDLVRKGLEEKGFTVEGLLYTIEIKW